MSIPSPYYFMCSRIGLSIVKRLARDGAAVVISSRRQAKVDKAVKEVEAEGGKVFGMVCHVGKPEHRQKLIEEVCTS